MRSKEWTHYKLGDIVDDVAMGPFGSNLKTDNFIEEGVPVIRGANLNEGGFDDDLFVFVSEEKAESLKRSLAYPDDLVFTHRGTIGQVGLIPYGEYPKYLVSQSQMRLTVNKEFLEPKFLYFFFKSPIGQYELLKNRSQVGVPAIASPTTSLKEVEILVPPLLTQRRIADILSALDDKIELNRLTNATLEAIAQVIFKELFVDNEDIIDWEASSLEELFGNKKDCVLTGPFGSHLHAYDYRDEGTPLILVKHVIDGYILEDGLPLVGDHKLSELKRYLLEVGDIVFTRVGAVGRSAYVHPRNEGWMISGQTLRVRIPDHTKLNPRYLAQVYLQPTFIQMVEQYAVGTTRPSLNTNILLSFSFLLPPNKLQNQFGEFVCAIDEMIQKNLDENRTLATLRDTLLPKLMSGEIEV